MSYTMDFESRTNARPDDSIIEYNGFVIGKCFLDIIHLWKKLSCFIYIWFIKWYFFLAILFGQGNQVGLMREAITIKLISQGNHVISVRKIFL